MTIRIAECSCGQLRLNCDGEPARVAICHCDACRRRTGSAFGIAAFYDRARVMIDGVTTRFRRVGDSGRSVEFHFCPHCGTTVYWEPERRPDVIAVAVGAFADRCFPLPDQSVWHDNRHDWVRFPESLPTRPGG